MFFSIHKFEEAVYPANQLQNPLNKDNPMTLRILRTQSRNAFFTVNSKKSAAEYWGNVDQKTLPKNMWTDEMKAFADQKIRETSAPSFVFKLSIIGWIFTAAVIGLFGYLVYDSFKPDAPLPAEYLAMEKKPQTGDIYFGRYETFSEPNAPRASDIGFGWFKINNVEGDTYNISKSTEISKFHKPKEQMNSIDFEASSIPVKITEQAGYMLNLKSTDDKMEIYLSDKK